MTKIFSIISLAMIAQPLSYVVVPTFNNAYRDEIRVTNIKLDFSSINLKRAKKTFKLTPTIEPSNATNQNVTWKSNNKSIATVDNQGIVLAKGTGSTTIICSSEENPKIKALCIVTVGKDEEKIKISKIIFSQTDVSFKHVGVKKKISYIIEPSNATVKDVVWKSNDESIATVNKNGLVTSISNGNTIITCSSVENPNVFAQCSVTVSHNTNIIVNHISIEPNELNANVGDTRQLTAKISPNNATNQEVTWESDNTSIAKVNQYGLFEAIGVGSTTITCTAKDGSGVWNKMNVNITNGEKVLVNGIDIEPQKLDLIVGEKTQLSAKISPNNATNQEVTWESDNTSIAKVNQYGLFEAIGVGSTTITCTAKDGSGVYDTIDVNVKDKDISVTDISINCADSKLNIKTCDDPIKLTAEVLPKDATNKSVTWTSSNVSVATIDSKSGLLIPHKNGSTTITCTANDGSGVYDKIELNVIESDIAAINWFKHHINAPMYGFKHNETLYSIAQNSNEIVFKKDYSTDGAFCGRTENDKIYAKYDDSTCKLTIWSKYKIAFFDEICFDKKTVLGVFQGCNNLKYIDFANTDFSNMTDFSSMFKSCFSLKFLDLSSFDTSNAKRIYDMFTDCLNLKRIFASKKFVIPSGLENQQMFAGCSNLTGCCGTTWSNDLIKTSAIYARIDNTINKANQPGYFTLKINNFSKTDYTANYVSKYDGCDKYDVWTKSFEKGHGTYFNEPGFFKFDTTCWSNKKRVILQQYCLDILVPAKTNEYSFNISFPYTMKVFFKSKPLFGTDFNACLQVDKNLVNSPAPTISYFSPKKDYYSQRFNYKCPAALKIGSYTWNNTFRCSLSLTNHTSKPQIQKCYLCLSLFICGENPDNSGETKVTFESTDKIKIRLLDSI